MRCELRLYLRRRAEGFIIQGKQILHDSTRSGLRIDRIKIPLIFRRRVHFVGVGLDQAGVSSDVNTADEAF